MKPDKKAELVSPPRVLGVASSFLNGIDLDPASSDRANLLVSAKRHFTKEDDGLKQEWNADTVYLYPPTRLLSSKEQPENTLLFEEPKRFKKSGQLVWFQEAVKRYLRGEFNEAIVFLTSSDVALLSTQRESIDFPMCIMRHKPKLYFDVEGLPSVNNSKCYGFIFYIPCPTNYFARIEEFKKAFGNLGRVYT